MELSWLIVKYLKKQTKPLSREQIVRGLREEYPDMKITSRKIRDALDRFITMENELLDEQKTILYKTYETKNGQERKSDYYYNNSISDAELRFLIDSVMYSKIFNESSALNLALRIQDLTGKNSNNIIPYVNESFGRHRYLLKNDVMYTVEKILDAKRKSAWIQFSWNNYDIVGMEIKLRKKEIRIAKPLKLLLNDGRYFVLLRHWESKKIYTYAIDLMSNIELYDKRDSYNDERDLKDFTRAEYPLQHQYMFGGKTEIYKLKVRKEYLSRLIDAFSYNIKVFKNNEKEDTVEVKVKATCKGMKYWLLQHYEVAEHIGDNEELERELAEAVETLHKKYCK